MLVCRVVNVQCESLRLYGFTPFVDSNLSKGNCNPAALRLKKGTARHAFLNKRYAWRNHHMSGVMMRLLHLQHPVKGLGVSTKLQCTFQNTSQCK
eukprot:1314385-Amphidinium_carterae.1